MKGICKLGLYFGIALAVVACGHPSSADASFRLRVESGTTTGPGVVITADGSMAFSGGSSYQTMANQFITFSGPIAGFAINATTGVSTPTLAAPGFYDAIDLSNITINSSGAGVLRLILEQDGLNTAPDGQITLRQDVGGVLTSAVGSTVTFDSYAVNGSGTPSLGHDQFPAGTLDPVTGIGAGGASTVSQTFGNGPLSGTASTSFNKSGAYSLYTVVTVNFTGAGSVSFNEMTGTTPAPAGFVLALTGLPVLGIGAWFRGRRRTLKSV